VTSRGETTHVLDDELSLPGKGIMTFIHQERQGFRARFQRHECKYLIIEAQAEGICRYIRPYVVEDPYAADSPDRSYDITSLYLDSPDLKLFRETRDGIKNRIKLRIRRYSEDESKPVFLEIKRRRNGLVLKGRARLPRDAMKTMLAGGVPDTSTLKGEEKACYDEFVGWVARWFAGSTIWVRYRREAYQGAINPGIRITLDRNIACSPAIGGRGSLGSPAWRPVESQKVVLELKFNTTFPGWLGSLVQRFCLERQSYSKYGNAILRGMHPWLLPPEVGVYYSEPIYEHS